MNNKINIIQFMPYFPPHKGGVETVGEEIGKYWIKKGFGEFINIVSDFEQGKNILSQSSPLEERGKEQIIFNGEKIGYKKDGYEVLIVPSFELINNFPVYKFWSKKYRIIIQYLNEKTSPQLSPSEERGQEQNWRVITHTRFFLTSFIGGKFARKNKIKWIHIEHGSGYVKLSSKIKSGLSKIYDKSFGKWSFKNADSVLVISEACKNFINKEFVNRDVNVFYRGIDLSNIKIKKEGEMKIVFVGRLVSLKGVGDLIKAYKKIGISNAILIIGDGEEKKYLEKISKGLNIDFLGYKTREYVLEYLCNNSCILVNPSYQEGMPTTVIEGLATGTPVIATNVGGTSEISDRDDLIIFESGDIKELGNNLIKGVNDYNNINGLSLELINSRFNREENIFSLYDFIK